VLLSPGPARGKGEIRERPAAAGSVGLADHRHEKATSLPYGAQRRLEIARALATEPALSAARRARRRHEPPGVHGPDGVYPHHPDPFDLTILLIEHDMKVVMGICEHIWVLDYGDHRRGQPGGDPSNPKVIEAYLGEEYVKYA
jgi:branched-chain amino acid transport system ATP-binding protein